MENGGSAWREVRLGDVSEITSSKRIFYSDYVNEGIPFWRSKEVIELFNRKVISTDLFITPNKYLEIKEKFGVPQEDDILLTSVGTLGIPYLVKGGDSFYFKDGNLTWMRKIDRSNLLPKYLYIWLSSRLGRDALYEITIGSTQEALTIRGLKTLGILLPPLPEQKAIAEVLSALDDKIDLFHRQNKTLEQMAETLFRQWFVVEAGEDWEVTTLGELIKIGSGKGLKKDKFDDGGKYPILGANGKIGRTNEYLFDERLIFTGRVGTLGNVFRVENKKIWLSDNTLVIKPKKYYNHIYFLLKNARLDQFNVGSTQPLIRQSDVKEIELSVADTKTHLYFEEECDLLFDKINKNKQQIRTLESLRDALLPKLMSGQIRVQYDKEAE